jgi:excisionase family DNA binding protein
VVVEPNLWVPAVTQGNNAEAPRGVSGAAPLPVYVTPRQVADMLVVDERTVLRWAQTDATMPVARFGGRVIRFERAALLRWVARKQPRLAQAHGVPAPAAPPAAHGSEHGAADAA